MPFPLTHLCVARRVLDMHPMTEDQARQFMLGTIAPDAIHYRKSYENAQMSNIGPAKKITHLCPVSEERWGQVTDNDGWAECVKGFLREHGGDPFCAGYGVHVLTDIFNNSTLWLNFRTKNPEEAAKGYQSVYYRDLHNIDLRIYHEMVKTSDIPEMLERAEPVDVPGLVSRDEIHAIKNNLLHIAYKDAPPAPDGGYSIIGFEEVADFIQTAADYSMDILRLCPAF